MRIFSMSDRTVSLGGESPENYYSEGAYPFPPQSPSEQLSHELARLTVRDSIELHNSSMFLKIHNFN